MVDFGRRNRGRLQPSRSLPQSAVHQRERSDVPQQRRSRRTTASETTRELQVPDANPYSSRSESRERITPRRSRSHGKMLPSRSQSEIQSSPPSRNFRILRAILSTVSLLMVGFGGGVVYNMFRNSNPTDVESIVSATDEVVKKLANTNQKQTQEIDALKRQVEQQQQQHAEQQQEVEGKSVEEQLRQESENRNDPDYAAIDKYKDNGGSRSYAEARPVGGLRAGNENANSERIQTEQVNNEEQNRIDDNNQKDQQELDGITRRLCIQHPLAEVKRICQSALNLEECFGAGCKGPDMARRYMEKEFEKEWDENMKKYQRQENSEQWRMREQSIKEPDQ